MAAADKLWFKREVSLLDEGRAASAVGGFSLSSENHFRPSAPANCGVAHHQPPVIYMEPVSVLAPGLAGDLAISFGTAQKPTQVLDLNRIGPAAY